MRILLISVVLVIGISSAWAQIKPPPKFGGPTPTRAKPKPPPPPPPRRKRVDLGPDPCINKKCSVGEECRRSKSNPKTPECACIDSCSSREFPDPLCTNTNRTFNSICDYERNQCLCKKRAKGCKSRGGNYVVYYAECQGDYCNKRYDMIDYGNRLAQWLRDTHAARAMIPSDTPTVPNEIMNPLGKKDRRISSAMYNSPFGNAIYVSWWFCDLDKDKSGSLDKKEVSVLTRALMPNEQCIQTFFAQCDKSGDKKISNAEWHSDNCFKVKKGKKSCGDLYRTTSFVA